MIAEQEDLNNLTIHWPRSSRIARIRRSGKCPSFAAPRHLRIPGGLVALADSRGRVLLLFRISHVERGVSVMGADGNRYENGCLLVARKGTMRLPGRRDPKVLSVNRHALGAFAYFDNKTLERTIYELPENNDRSGGGTTPQMRHFPSRQYPLFANNIGKTLSQPERELILSYVNWIGKVDLFAHHPLKHTGLYTDLFIPRCWTLFEAKASTLRRTLREAIGQLFDYQRHYNRSPRLAVLLPGRPEETVMELFDRKRIIVVWKSRGGAFRDSADGVLTTELRS